MDELQKNCNATIKLFSKLASKVDPETLDSITEIIDNLNLANYQVTKLKNDIAMKSYKREMTLHNDMVKTDDTKLKLEEKIKDYEQKITNLDKTLKDTESELEKVKSEAAATTGKIADFETNAAKVKDQAEKFETKIKESENLVANLETKVKKYEENIAKLENERKEQNQQIEELTLERENLKKSFDKKSDKTILDPEYLMRFNKRQAELRTEITNEIKRWSEIKSNLEKTQGKSGKDSAPALKEIEQKLLELEKSLEEKEKKLKSKSTKDRGAIQKERQNIKQKLTRARKKYESLKEDLKINYKDGEKAEKLKNEISEIVDKIDELQKEYDRLSKDLELDQDTFFTLFESLARITNEAPKNFKELMDQSLEREHLLETKLNVTLKNVEELEKEMERVDQEYHSDIKQEFERLAKKEEDKYKKMLKKQEEKYRKELEVAAQTMFELKQYIEELESPRSTGKKPVSVPATNFKQIPSNDVAFEFNHKASPYSSVATAKPNLNRGKLGLPLKKPKNDQYPQPSAGSRKARRKRPVAKHRKSEMGKCGSCGEYIPIDSDTCPECGATFEVIDKELVVCGNCGETIPATVKICPLCNAQFE